MKITNFKASNGYITRFVKRYDIKYESKSGESESVSEILVNEWKTKLIEKYSNYELTNVWNIDETGLFWRLIQNNAYSMPEESKKGFKKSKDRVTLLLVNADGSERLLVVIGKSREPRYFRGIKNLPIWLYFYNTSAWMTSEILSQIMLKLDKKFKQQKRNVLVMLDNCSSHPHISLENTELLFLPPNTTSRLQALDAGIIRSFKQRYRNKMLKFVIELLDDNEDNDLSDVIKRLTLLKAIYFMHSSNKEIPNSVFINCFKECGVAFDFVENESHNDLNDDLFVENNWNSINHRLELGFESYEEFVSIDDEITYRQELTDEQIIESVRPTEEIVCDSSDTEIEDNDNEVFDNISFMIPSKSEALNEVFNLRLYLGSLSEVDSSYYDLLIKFENLILKMIKSQSKH